MYTHTLLDLWLSTLTSFTWKNRRYVHVQMDREGLDSNAHAHFAEMGLKWWPLILKLVTCGRYDSGRLERYSAQQRVSGQNRIMWAPFRGNLVKFSHPPSLVALTTATSHTEQRWYRASISIVLQLRSSCRGALQLSSQLNFGNHSYCLVHMVP